LRKPPVYFLVAPRAVFKPLNPPLVQSAALSGRRQIPRCLKEAPP
jgi:hypothetical protein